MIDATLLAAILNSLAQPILIADTGHITRYMNKAAIAHYEGGASLIGRSVLECHNLESQRKMVEILAAFQAGQNECLSGDNEKRRLFMVAVRDAEGNLLGYYERVEKVKKAMRQ
jgi:DUF438 domain-containing protein